MYSFNVTDFDQWRAIARALVKADIAPSSVSWQTPEQQGLFSSSTLEDVIALADPSCMNRPLRVPREFLERAKQASCYSDMKNPAKKWSILYSLLWRLEHYGEETLLLQSDLEVRCLDSMCKAVSRDMHKMKAFVRFKKLVDGKVDQPDEYSVGNNNEYYVAWFEPSHAIIESIAPFFVKRFTGMSWSILTPQGCAHWDMEHLKISEGVIKPEISADAFDIFWKAYYCSIFNPARLKEHAMRSEMPKKYWKYLPEATCIQDLARGAAASTAQMIDAPATSSERARDKSQWVADFQNKLRTKNGNGKGVER